MSWRYFPILVALLSGCVTVYEPLVGLSRPSVINPELANFDGVNLKVRCIPSDYTDTGDSEVLCNNVKLMLSNQGAHVETEVPEADMPPPEDEQKQPDLILELASRLVHSENSALVWALFYATFTIFPAITDATFSQDVVLKDSEGFLPGQDKLEGRFTRYVSLVYWGINALADLILRPKEERITAGATKNDFSRDFYGQISQATFHALMRQKVLKGFDEPPPAPSETTGPVAPQQGRPKPGPAAKPGTRPAAPKAGPAPAPAPVPKPIPVPTPKPTGPSKPDSDFTPFPTGPK